MKRVHAVVPSGVADPQRPSGGNAYDLRVLTGLRDLGWTVCRHEVDGSWPRADLAARARLAGVLARIYRREITVHLEIDPELLGGLVIQVGDEVIDGSAAGKLDDLGRRLG